MKEKLSKVRNRNRANNNNDCHKVSKKTQMEKKI